MENTDGTGRRKSTSFRTTRWSLVQRAAGGAEQALDEWVRTAWYPLYTWARRKELTPEDAADAVQEFLGKICTRGALEKLDPLRGRLRSWLLAGFSNHLATRRDRSLRLKRGAGVKHFSLDRGELEIFFQNDMAAIVDPDKAYSRAWALMLMDEAMARLEKHYVAGDRGELFETLLPALESPLTDTTYEQSATRLGLSGAALRQAAVRFRQRYRRLLLDVAGERLGITCRAQLAEELRGLLNT